jgi:hypothetical protein
MAPVVILKYKYIPKKYEKYNPKKLLPMRIGKVN